MVIGRRCAALYDGLWIRGTILKHDVVNMICTIKTKTLGVIKVSAYRIRMSDKEDEVEVRPLRKVG